MSRRAFARALAEALAATRQVSESVDALNHAVAAGDPHTVYARAIELDTETRNAEPAVNRITQLLRRGDLPSLDAAFTLLAGRTGREEERALLWELIRETRHTTEAMEAVRNHVDNTLATLRALRAEAETRASGSAGKLLGKA